MVSIFLLDVTPVFASAIQGHSRQETNTARCQNREVKEHWVRGVLVDCSICQARNRLYLWTSC